MKCIIAGSRNFNNYDLLKSEIIKSGFTITEIVSGGANGADKLGEVYATEKSIPMKLFQANWDDINAEKVIVRLRNGRKYNILAGYNRNEQMAEYADCLIAFSINDSKGTAHMIKIARAKGLKIHVVNVSEQI